MFKKKQKPKFHNIKIKITVSKDKISWKANIDNMDLIFYLQRVIYFINREMDKTE